jgi:hypothetical protein
VAAAPSDEEIAVAKDYFESVACAIRYLQGFEINAFWSAKHQHTPTIYHLAWVARHQSSIITDAFERGKNSALVATTNPAAFNPVVQASYLLPNDVKALGIFAQDAAKLSTVKVSNGDKLDPTMPALEEIGRRHRKSGLFQNGAVDLDFGTVVVTNCKRTVIGDDSALLYKLGWGGRVAIPGTYHVNIRHQQPGQILVLPNGENVDRVDYDGSIFKRRVQRIAKLLKPPRYRPPVTAIPGDDGPERDFQIKQRQEKRNLHLHWKFVERRTKHHDKDAENARKWVRSGESVSAEEFDEFDANEELFKLNRRAFAAQHKSYDDIAAIKADELRMHAPSFHLVKSATLNRLRRSIARALGYTIPKIAKKST